MVRRFVFRLLLSWAILSVGTSSKLEAQTSASEYEVKAAFLYNFVQFVKWPSTAFPSAGAPITIGILGDDPFGGSLEKAIQNEAVGGRKLGVRRSRRMEDLKGCNLVFVCKSERGRLAEVLSSFQGTNILTVGEVDEFTRQGGMISFTMSGGKVGFEINAGAARKAGLEISSRLLKLGRTVGA